MGKIWNKIKGKRLIALLLVLALVVVIWRACSGRPADASATDIQYLSATADRGTITASLSGSGTLEPADAYTVTTLTSGEILSADFEEGDVVEKDEVLYQVDSSDASSGVERAELSLSQAQRSYERALEQREDMSVKAGASGTVTELLVEAGDEVAAGQTLAEVRSQDTMRAEIPFLAGDAAGISAGQSAAVTLDSTFETLSGTVTRVSGADQVLAGGRVVRMVTVQIHNPGAIAEGTAVTAEVNGAACAGSGTLSWADAATVTAPAGGTVDQIFVSEGAQVGEHTALLHIDSDTVEDAVDSAYRALRDAEISLDNQNDTLDNYSITSPIQGTIVEKNYKAGDTLEAGKSLCTIYDLSYLTVTLNIDELDIASLAVGQGVTITADALEGQSFAGTVTNVSIKGATAGGVTSYPVTVRIDQAGGLLPGMNVDCTIVTSSAENALRIPAAAVDRSGRVLVKGADSGGDETLPEGYGYREVEIGISDGDYAQVLSGLEEGDEILYLPAADSAGGLFGPIMGGMGGGGAVVMGPGM